MYLAVSTPHNLYPGGLGGLGVLGGGQDRSIFEAWGGVEGDLARRGAKIPGPVWYHLTKLGV